MPVTHSTTSQSLLAAALQHFTRQQPQRGLELAEQAAAAANGNDELLGVATLLLRFGRPAKAAEVFRAMLTANPRSITALANIAQLEREHDTADVSAMLELAGTTDPDRDSGIQLSFALGKTFADLGQFDRSFEFYARANAGRNVLVVTHQGVVKAVVYHLLGRAFLPDEPPAFDRRLIQQVVCQGGVLTLGQLDIDPAAL